MARTVANFRAQAEAPFLKTTWGVLASLSDQSSWLLDLQWYLRVASGAWLIQSQTQQLAETFESLDTKISHQEKLTQSDYMRVVDALIDLIDASFLNEETKIETLRQAILQRMLKDQDLHHKITSAFSVVEVISIVLSTVIYAVNCTWIAPISTIPMLAWPYLQYKGSEPLHDYRQPLLKNYQLQLKHFEIEEKNRSRNPILYLIYAVAFTVSVHTVPYSYVKENTPSLGTKEATTARAWNDISWKMSIAEAIRWPYFVGLWLCLEILAAYLFMFQAKSSQKTIAKRTGVLLPYLERLPNKNQDFFLKTLETLRTFKNAVAEVKSQKNVDEKAFYRLVNTLNESLTKLEWEAHPEIQKLFQQTTELIAKLTKNVQCNQNLDAWTYPLLEFIRRRTEKIQVQNFPAKWKTSEDLPETSTQVDSEQPDTRVDLLEENMKIIKEINLPNRMEKAKIIDFLEFMGGTRKERKWSHYSYEITHDSSTYSVVLWGKDEYFWDTVRSWIMRSGLPPEFVLQKWQEFNTRL